MTVLFLKEKRRGRAVRARGNAQNYEGTLYGLKRGERATIVRVSAEGGALARLEALGVRAGANVEAVAFSLFKSSILISCGSVRLAMRRALAVKISVKADIS